MNKFIIHDPKTGDIVYYGSRPNEPLTPKKKEYLNNGFILQAVMDLPAELRSTSMNMLKWDGDKIVKKKGKARVAAELVELRIDVRDALPMLRNKLSELEALELEFSVLDYAEDKAMLQNEIQRMEDKLLAIR